MKMETKNGKKDTRFQPGNTLGKGRGVSGRRKTLDIMDKMLSMAGNQKKLMDDFQKLFDKSPAKFWKTFALPVLPPMTKDPRLEEDLAYTDEERLREITTLFNGARKRQVKQAVEDDSEVESGGFEFSTN